MISMIKLLSIIKWISLTFEKLFLMNIFSNNKMSSIKSNYMIRITNIKITFNQYNSNFIMKYFRKEIIILHNSHII
jgi:hypothetical protein